MLCSRGQRVDSRHPLAQAVHRDRDVELGLTIRGWLPLRSRVVRFAESLCDQTADLLERLPRGGTVLVQLHHKGKLDDRLVAELANPDAGLRLIICARTLDKAEASFPAGLVSDAKKIALSPLRERMSEIPELLNRWFFDRGICAESARHSQRHATSVRSGEEMAQNAA